MDNTPKTSTTPITFIGGESGQKPTSDKSVFVELTEKSQPSPAVNGAFCVPNNLSQSGKFTHLPVIGSHVPPLMLAVPAAIETAEGYVELVTLAAARLGVDQKLKKKFAANALSLAISSGECWHNAKHEARRQMVMGHALRILRRHRAASIAFRTASKNRASRLEALRALAKCQRRLGQFAEGIVTLTRALAITPEDPRLHYNLARYLCVSGQCRAAIYELAWALELNPKLKTRAIQDADFELMRAAPAFLSLTATRSLAK